MANLTEFFDLSHFNSTLNDTGSWVFSGKSKVYRLATWGRKPEVPGLSRAATYVRWALCIDRPVNF